MFYAVPTNLKYGEGFRVREFEEEAKLKSFLLNTEPSEKYMIICGEQMKYSKRTEVILTTKSKEE